MNSFYNYNIQIDMNSDSYNRAISIGKYIVTTKSTIRATAKTFGLSKSCVHKDIHVRLPKINYSLFLEVQKVINFNTSERSKRGGLATKLRWKEISEK